MKSMRERSILLVEDEKLIALSESRILEKQGFRVTTAFSGEEALEVVEASPAFDLILMDINLGEGMDGTEAAELILAKRDIPIVFLSSHVEKEIVERTEGISSYGYIVKNSGETVLLASIKMAFKLSEAHINIQAQRMDIEAAYEEMQVSNEELLRVQRELIARDLALAESESRYRDIYDSAVEGIFETTAEGRLIGANPAYAATFGYASPEDILNDVDNIGKQLYAREEDRARLFRILNEGRPVLNFEVKARNRRGAPIWVSINAIARRDEGGAIVGITGSTIDITERKRAEARLRESEEEFRTIFENAPLGLLRYDEQGRILVCNDHFVRVIGSSREKVLGLDITRLPNRDMVSAISRALAGRPGKFEGEYRSVTAEKLSLVRVLFEPILDAEGLCHGGVGIIEDISERMLAENVLRESEEKHRQLIENNHDVIYTLSLEGLILFVSPAWTAMLGHEVSDVVGQPFQRFVHAQDVPRCEAWLRNIIESGKDEEGIEYRIRHIDGNWRWHTSSGVPLRDRLGVVMGLEGTARDISERKRAEEKVRDLLREKELLLKETQHRVKNNMNVIASLLSMQASAQEVEAARAVIADAASRVQNMMVLYDKLYRSATRGERSLEAFLPPLVEEIVRIFPTKRPVSTELEIDDLVLEEGLLSTIGIIVNELITNSMKYAFEGRRDNRISVSAAREGDGLALAYRDNGVGLPESMSLESSSGFGMQLISMLVEQLHGHIGIQRGAGAHYRIEIPL